MTYLTLLRYWYVVVILILGFSVDHFYDQHESALKDIKNLEQQIEINKKEYELELSKMKIKYQEDIIDQQSLLIEANNVIVNAVHEFNIKVDKQNERTKEIHKEIQTTIPVTIAKSCDFGSSWLSIANRHIQESNSSVTDNSK